MKNKKVNATLARAIAGDVQTLILESRKKDATNLQKELSKSSELKRMISLFKEGERLRKSGEAIEEKLERGTDKVRVQIYHDGSVRCNPRELSINVAEIKNAILIASHIDGVDARKLASYVAEKIIKEAK